MTMPDTPETRAPHPAVMAEQAVWQALMSGDMQADEALLSSDFVGVYPDGLSGKAGHVQQLAEGPVVAEARWLDWRVIEIEPHLALVTYTAQLRRTGATAWEAMRISSLWRMEAGHWLNLFSQDTPCPLEGLSPD